MERCSVVFPPPSPTDDHRPPTPTVVAEVTCGERRKEAFGTCARVAGSFVSVASPAVPLGATVITRRLLAVNPDLSPLGGCRVGQEEGGAGRECQASHHVLPRGEGTPPKVSLVDFIAADNI